MEKTQFGKQIDLSIIIPVFNEEDIIDKFFNSIQEVRKQLKGESELIFVNDGSIDRTLEILKDLVKKYEGIHVINLSRNFGHQLAVLAGLHSAEGKRAVFLDCDLQDPPELILEMSNEMDNNGYDIVAAKRLKREGEGFFKRTSAFIFYRFLKMISKVDLPLDVGDFQMINDKMLQVFKGIKGENLYLRGFIPWMGFKRKTINYERKPREAGKTKYSLKKMIELGLNGVLSLSYFPLKLCSFTGVIVVISSFLYILRILYIRFILDIAVVGWTSVMTIILFLGGIQILFIGILGEYIAKIYQFVDDKPAYIISDKISSAE
jgi:glycosyltransferase involved in cell wall biosynthesis